MDQGDETTFRTIQRRVQQRLDELELDMKGVSLEAGLGATFVRDMLKRHRAPSAESLSAIARVLKTSSGWLTGETSDSDPSGGLVEIGTGYDAPQLVTVAEYDVRLSAGAGALIERENQTGVWQLPRRYVVDELRLQPSNLAVVEVQGDSMYPTLHTGDRVVIDHSDRNPALPGVYAIWDSNATVVKRIERIPASDPPMLVLISDNKNHHEYTVPADAVQVIGRVVWVGRRM